MGVHLTFVRSVDLDEWTQRQIDAMRLGGNDNAKKFFRKHGCTDSKGEKKYTSKAAVAYRTELAKLVEAEAAKRGEGSIDATSSSSSSSSSSAAAAGGNLFDNADASMNKMSEDEARARVDAARSNGGAAGSSSAGVLQPTAKLASEMTGTKGKLTTPAGTPAPTPPASGGVKGGVLKPPSNNGPKLVLRKPGTSTASSRLFKKTSTSSTASRIRVNKITTPVSTSSISMDDDAFEDVETTQKNIEESKNKEEEDKKRQQEEDAALAKQLQDELNGLGGTATATQATASVSSLANGTAVPPTPTSTPASGFPAEPPKPKMSAMEENMAKLSAMNDDFFSGL